CAATSRMRNLLRDGQPTQSEGHLAVEYHSLEDVVGPDVAGLGGKEKGDGREPDAWAQGGPDAACEQVDRGADYDERQYEEEEEPGGQAKRSGGQVEDDERAAMRVEVVECLDERITDVKLRVLLVQQQRQSVRLITIKAVISPESQI